MGDADPTTADWFTAIGGVGAFVAAIVLAVLAYLQMRAAQQQSKAAQEQSKAALDQANATREAAERQTYPLVYAHEWRGAVWNEEEQAFAVRYYLSNEGLGPALNVEHGVQIGPVQHIFGHEGPYRFRSIQPGEFLPPLDSNVSDPVPPAPIIRFVSREDYEWRGPSEVVERVYICRYEDLFGARWETRNSSDPSKRAEVKRLDPED